MADNQDYTNGDRPPGTGNGRLPRARKSELAELRQAIGPDGVPDYTTLYYAEKRLLRKQTSPPCSMPA